jgi:hypothetical protein
MDSLFNKLRYTADVLASDHSTVLLASIAAGFEELSGRDLEQAQLHSSEVQVRFTVRPDVSISAACYVAFEGATYAVDYLRDPGKSSPSTDRGEVPRGALTEIYAHRIQDGTNSGGIPSGVLFEQQIDGSKVRIRLNPILSTGLPSSGLLNEAFFLTDTQQIAIWNGTAFVISGKAYTDTGNASTLAAAQAYTDSSIAGVAGAGVQVRLAGAGSAPVGYVNDGPPSGWNPFIFQQDNSNVWHAVGGVDSSTASPNDGTLTWVRRMYFRDNKATAQVGKNAFISINHLTGAGVSSGIQDRAMWISHSTPSGAYSCYGIEGLQIEMDINGTPTFTGSPDAEAQSLSLQMADTHQGNLASPTAFGVGLIRGSFFREDTAGCWTSPIAVIGIEYQNQSTVAGNGQAVAIFKAKAQDLTGTAKNIPIYYFWASPKPAVTTYRFASNYGFICDNFGANAADYNFYSQGVNAAGTAAGFNAFQGPTVLGALAHAAAGYQLEVTGGKVKVTATGGASYIDFIGSTSGSAGIGVAAAAGTPNAILLPTATGAGGSFLKTDGGTPQQTSWAAIAYTDVSGLSAVAHTGAYTDLSSLPTLPQTKAAVASNFLTSYTSGTGVFTAAQPTYSDISGSLPASSMPVVDGGFFITETGINPLTGIFANSAGNITANNIVRGCLFVLKSRYTISKYGFDATATGATSPVMDVGIMDTSFNLLTHSGAIALSGVAAAYNGNLLTTITIGPGAFYFVWTGNASASIASVAYVALATNSGQAAFSTVLNSSRQRYWSKSAAATAGVLPSSLSSPTTALSTDAFAPAVLFE